MLTPDEAELRLLSSIRDGRDLSLIVREGLTESAFSIYGEVFTYFTDYMRLYGSIPEREDLESVFDHLELSLSEPGELPYYVDEVRKLEIVRKAQSSIIERFGDGGEHLEFDPVETVRLLSEDLLKLQSQSTRHIAWLDRDAMERLEWLDERAEASRSGRVLGIPTGLKCFDLNMMGWGPGEAIMLMAPKGTGKSWLALYFGVVGYRAGYKVLFLSPEMTYQECALRYDVLLAKRAGITLSHSALSTGQQDRSTYEEWLTELTRRDQFIVEDSPGVGGFTTANILASIDTYRPDLVILDGIHLVGGEDGQTGWERIKQVADALKATAQHLNCTVIWTSQVDREAMRNPTEPASSGASAAYGKAAVEAANRLITMATNEGNSKRRTFKVPNNRSGREFHIKQHLHFDVDIGDIYQLDMLGPLDEGEET